MPKPTEYVYLFDAANDHREMFRPVVNMGGQIDAGSLLQDLYYKSDSSTRKELEKERGSADEITIRGTSDSLLNLQ
jgi:hypothetical protein